MRCLKRCLKCKLGDRSKTPGAHIKMEKESRGSPHPCHSTNVHTHYVHTTPIKKNVNIAVSPFSLLLAPEPSIAAGLSALRTVSDHAQFRGLWPWEHNSCFDRLLSGVLRPPRAGALGRGCRIEVLLLTQSLLIFLTHTYPLVCL